MSLLAAKNQEVGIKIRKSEAAKPMTRTSLSLDSEEPSYPETVASVCEELRHATHAAHVRINHHPYLSGLLKAGYPLSKYQNLLAMYTALYAAIRVNLFSDYCKGNESFRPITYPI